MTTDEINDSYVHSLFTGMDRLEAGELAAEDYFLTVSLGVLCSNEERDNGGPCHIVTWDRIA